MTDDEPRPTWSPGAGDPTKSDTLDHEGMRTDIGGSAPEDRPTAPTPGGEDEADIETQPPSATASGGYGSGSGYASSAGSPDGGQQPGARGPGPQTEWMRSAPGAGPASSAESGRGEAERGPRDSDALGE